jgi:hypothetical protein
MVKERVHTWDKVATYKKGNELRDQVYVEAIEKIKTIWQTSRQG